jgi:hypothetical protein
MKIKKKLIISGCLIVGICLGFLGITILTSVFATLPPDIVKPPTANQYLVDLIVNKQSKLDPVVVEKIAMMVEKYSVEYKIPPELILAIIEKESSFKQLAISSADCVGLMQINPKAHPEKIQDLEKGQIYHIDHNIRVGCMIFREYFEATNNIEETLSKYLGKKDINYINNILVSFSNMLIKKQQMTN